MLEITVFFTFRPHCSAVIRQVPALILALLVVSQSPWAEASNPHQKDSPENQCEIAVNGESGEPGRMALSFLKLIQKWILQHNDTAQINDLALAITSSSSPVNPFSNQLFLKDIQIQNTIDHLLPYLSDDWSFVQKQIPELVRQRQRAKELIEKIDTENEIPLKFDLVQSIETEDVTQYRDLHSVQLTDGTQYLTAVATVGIELEAIDRQTELHIFRIDSKTKQATLTAKIPYSPSNDNDLIIGLKAPYIPLDDFHFLARKIEQGQRSMVGSIVAVDVRDGSQQPWREDLGFWPLTFTFSGENSVLFTTPISISRTKDNDFYLMNLETKEVEQVFKQSLFDRDLIIAPNPDGSFNLIVVSRNTLSVSRFHPKTKKIIGPPVEFQFQDVQHYSDLRFYTSKNGNVYITTFSEKKLSMYEYSVFTNKITEIASNLPPRDSMQIVNFVDLSEDGSFHILATSSSDQRLQPHRSSRLNYWEFLKYNSATKSLELLNTEELKESPLSPVHQLNSSNRSLLLNNWCANQRPCLQEFSPESENLVRLLELKSPIDTSRVLHVIQDSQRGDFFATISLTDENIIQIYNIFD